MTARLLFCAASLSMDEGGIARVARLMLGTAQEAGTPLAAMALLGEGAIALGDLRVRQFGGSKPGFFAAVQLGSLGMTHILFDSAGLARARPRPPFPMRPYAVFMHGIEAWEALRPRGRYAFERARLVIVNSAYTLARHQALHGLLPHARVCPLSTESEGAPTRLSDFSGPPTVLILGRIETKESYKGHDELIAAWPEVRLAVPGARLLIAGGGSGLERIRSLAAVTRGVEVLGFVAESDLPGLWGQAHVFAMPSRNEGFGIVYAEAMRYSLPVLASTHDAGREVNVHGETGLNVDLDAPGALAAALVALLRDPNRARILGAAGHERWRQHYRPSVFRERFTPMLLEFLSDRALGARSPT
jgi:phosphatidylinositol alpha-1,6-mannosyltransferase